jgi:predicted nucleotide-binding protein (sugar kinase/HSP70/actin superfamily)
MSVRVSFKIRKEEVAYVQNMATALGISTEELAKKSLFQMVNRLYEMSDELTAAEEAAWKKLAEEKQDDTSGTPEAGTTTSEA